jgi:anti-sigma factor RsiW
MSGKKTYNDVELMLYADGELPEAEAREVSAWLAENADARLKLESLRQVGEAVRTFTELETDRAEVEVPAFADMWQRIERRVHANGRAEPAEEAAEGAPENGSRARRVRDTLRPPVAGWWAATRRWFEDHRGHVLTGAISAGVACALMLALGRETIIEVPIDDSRAKPPPVKFVAQPPEVEDLEVYEGSGTILTIEPEGDDDSAAAVIWISSDQEANREGPL